MTLPLTGIVVVALEQAVSAPFATRQLADMGARVIQVERVGEGDLDHRGVHEVREDGGGIAGQAETGGDGLSGGQVDPVGERGEVSEQPLLGFGQQRVGPLHGVAQRAVSRVGAGPSVAEQVGEALRILRRRDDENVANPRQHQRAERVVNHRLVLDRQQLL